MRKPPLKRFPQFYTGRKETLTDEEMLKLLRNPFIVEEKLDGSLHVVEQNSLYLMLEDLKYTHSIFYNRLPARYVLIDVCHSNGDRFPFSSRFLMAQRFGYPMPPVILISKGVSGTEEKFLEIINSYKISEFSNDEGEGFVIKSEKYMDLGGKHSRLDLEGKERYDKSRTNHIIGQ